MSLKKLTMQDGQRFGKIGGKRGSKKRVKDNVRGVFIEATKTFREQCRANIVGESLSNISRVTGKVNRE